MQDMDFKKSLGGRVLNSAERFPERPALWVAGNTLTYQDLLQQGQSLAQVIQPFEGGTQVKAGIFVYRSAGAYCGILGALLAGAAYVPLNPRFPVERSRLMIEQAGINILFIDKACEKKAAEILSEISMSCRVVLLDQEGTLPDWALSLKSKHKFILKDGLPSPDTWALPQSMMTDDLAYLLFTSGTTGRPKGVGVSHGNVNAFLDHMQQTWPLEPEDRCTQIYDLTFDVSVNDIFSCWQSGACLYVVPEAALLCPVDFVRKHELTCWGSVPSALAFIKRFNKLQSGYLPSLRHSFFCGEALPTDMAVAWADAAPQSRVINLFGPTEATVAITAYELDRNDIPEYSLMPIGYPFIGQAAVALNKSGEKVKCGEVGDLYLGGSQLVAGYWQDRARTDKVFVETSIADESPDRWYKAGDLASVDERYGLIFHGRSDFQVRVNGYRVELSEIEGVVKTFVNCAWAVAIPWPIDKETGTASGIVVWVGALEKGFNLDDIPRICSQKLPAYMVPSAVYWMDTLPRNANGKVDIAALQAETLKKEQG